MISAMSLIVALAVAAPIPKGAAADSVIVEPTGPSPRLDYLKADAAGNIYVNLNRLIPTEMVQNGKVVTMYVPVLERVEIRLLKNAIMTPDGAKVAPEEAYRKLRAGGYVAISGDGKAVSAGYLRALNRDVLIFAPPAIATPEPNRAAVPPTPKKD